MAASVQVVEVNTVAEIDNTINAWIVQGYTVANRTPIFATLVKPKQFSALWAVIGLVVYVIPLIVYLFMYAAEKDKVVEVRLRSNSLQTGFADELERLHGLLQQGTISQQDYDEAKSRLM